MCLHNFRPFKEDKMRGSQNESQKESQKLESDIIQHLLVSIQ